MEPLEHVTVLMTLMKRLQQVMDHERAILRSMRLDALPDVQDEKTALAEAYEIELGRLRTRPETLASLEAPIREQLYDAMRQFQDHVSANLNALLAAQNVVERVLRNIAESLTRQAASPVYGAHGESAEAEPRGQVISVAFDRKL